MAKGMELSWHHSGWFIASPTDPHAEAFGQCRQQRQQVLPVAVVAENVHRSEDVLPSAANSRRRGVRFLQRPFRRERVEGPEFRMLLAAAALIVSSISDDVSTSAIVPS
jgi:hypothetical protein